MTITWNSQADAKLLLGIIKTGQKIDFKAVAEFMGEGCTQKAIRHRISRLQFIAGVKEEPGTPKRGPKKSKVLLTDGKASPSQRKRSKSNEDEMEQFEKKTKLEKEEDLDEFA